MKSLSCPSGHENPPGSRFCLHCGQKLDLPVNQGIQSGQILGDRYQLIRQIGHGGFGRTYLAADLNRFKENCVLKEFAPDVQGTYALQKAEELFEREAGILYQLQHPQIPHFRELLRVKQEETNKLFLVQDFVEGQTYYSLVEQRKRQGLKFNEAEATQLIVQILPVLQYIHSLGVIHRDISPDNLMLRTTDGLPVLIDFGGVKQVAATVASQFMATAPSTATRLGKVGYAPQEQMLKGIVSPSSDLYALAATVLVLLTGKEPSQLIDQHNLNWNWRREVQLSPRLGNVLDKMLQFRPGDRYQNVPEVQQALSKSSPAKAYPSLPQPQPLTKATVAVAPGPVKKPPSPPPAQALTHSTNDQSFNWLRTISFCVILMVIAGSFGWWAGNRWLDSLQQSRNPDDNTIIDDQDSPSEPTKTPSLSLFSAEEQERKQNLERIRNNLGVDKNFLVDLVNEIFWIQYPELRGSELGSGQEDAPFRERWDTIALEQLEKLDQADLSSAARRQLGNYGQEDINNWKREVNKLRLSSRALYDLADAKFFEKFPEQKEEKDFIKKPIGQVWQAIVADKLKELKSKNALERIVFDPETVSKEASGNLKSGEGKAFIAQLSEGQQMEVKLQAGEGVLFSVYSPSGETTILEDSPKRTWSGKLPESGFYEFVIVSLSEEPMDYQFNLRVEDVAPVQPPTEDSSGELNSDF
ncbi:MAG: serine/threonine-protein kinase [Coleofasciculaceae cyanobacterium]